jgi:hypothetical protein
MHLYTNMFFVIIFSVCFVLLSCEKDTAVDPVL